RRHRGASGRSFDVGWRLVAHFVRIRQTWFTVRHVRSSNENYALCRENRTRTIELVEADEGEPEKAHPTPSRAPPGGAAHGWTCVPGAAGRSTDPPHRRRDHFIGSGPGGG